MGDEFGTPAQIFPGHRPAKSALGEVAEAETDIVGGRGEATLPELEIDRTDDEDEDA